MPAESAVSPSRFSEDAVVLVGHGASNHPDAGRAAEQLAGLLAARGLFKTVRAGFLRQAPFARDVLEEIEAARVFVVPVLAHLGVIAQEVIPRALGLSDSVTERRRGGNPQTVVLCAPLGTHPETAALLAERAAFALKALGLETKTTALLLVGHGSENDAASKAHTTALADDMKKDMTAAGVETPVHAAFLEQAPYLRDWANTITAETVLAVPLLLSGGRHGAADVPAAFGVDPKEIVYDKADGLAAGPYAARGRAVFLLRPLGDDPALADVALALVEACAEAV